MSKSTKGIKYGFTRYGHRSHVGGKIRFNQQIKEKLVKDAKRLEKKYVKK